ncbi:MAG: hypothetical protein LBF97_01185 [Elusimicrobiota bacterium]|jgi:hypothetical protein|nr:hypothetical protein [Elusimicrobiota bacterium]
MKKDNINKDLYGILDLFGKKLMRDIGMCLPGLVVEYNRENNLAKIKIAIDMLLENGDRKTRSIIEVPVYSYGGGGFFINFPLKKDDTGWVIVNDRDISLFLDDLKQSEPNTLRFHKYSDAVFFPDKIKLLCLDEVDSSNLVIQNLEKTTKISISQEKITIKTADKLLLNGESEAVVLGNTFLSAINTILSALASHTHTNGNAGNPTGAPIQSISTLQNSILSKKNFGG